MTIAWYNAADVQIVAAIELDAEQGTPGTAFQLDLYNNRPGTPVVSTLVDLYLEVLEEIDGTAYSFGQPALDDHHVEARIVEGIGQTVSATPWTPIGTGRWLAVPPIGNGLGIRFEVRLSPPATAPSASHRFKFQVRSRSMRPIPLGISEAAADGVLHGIGDGTYSALYSGGVLAENPGGADEFVELSDTSWIYQGAPYALLVQLVELTDVDGDSATLASGESYIALFSLGTGVTVTKGSKSAGTPTAPEAPAGEIVLGTALRHFDAIVENADIEATAQAGFFGWSASGLTATLGPGDALVDNRLIHLDGVSQASLTASETNEVWLQVDGTLAVTIDGTRPGGRSAWLYTAVTDGSGVTSLIDRRRFVGGQLRPMALVFDGEIAANSAARGAVETNRPLYLLPQRPVQAWLHDGGASLTGGATLLDVEYSVAGAAWVSLFTSSGTDDRRPSIDFDDTTLEDRDAVPEVVAIPAGARVRARANGVPTGGGGETLPGGFTVVLRGVIG